MLFETGYGPSGLPYIGTFGEVVSMLKGVSKEASADGIQNEIFRIGKENGFDNLREWFKALYEILLGQSNGPRMGSFIALYGVGQTIKLIEDILTDV